MKAQTQRPTGRSFSPLRIEVKKEFETRILLSDRLNHWVDGQTTHRKPLILR
jgi:hypothetical protein